MRRYETTFIVNPDLGEEEIQATINKFTRIISGQGGTVLKQDEWGRRRLAYKIGKFTHGYYVLADFAGDPATLAELERNLKLDDRIIRFLSVKIGENVNVEALLAEIAAKIKKQEEAAAPPPPSAEPVAPPLSETPTSETPTSEISQAPAETEA